MFRALLWKGWRELRMLRWGGVALGLLLPLMLLAAAEAAVRGWLPFGRVSAYSASTVLFDVAPGVMVGALWPLMALLMSAQVFAGDRSDGTESFLLERPVPRPRIWWARFLVALGSTLTTALWSLGSWALFAFLLGNPGTASFSSPMKTFGIGVMILVAALLGGVAGASFVRAPLAGLLLGLILGGIPFVIAAVLSGVFPMALYRWVPVGMMVPWVLPVGYGVASYLMFCRGEPAGRGRLLRGGLALAIALVFVPSAFAVAAPLALRWEASRLPWGAYLVPSPKDKFALARGGIHSAAWLIDLGSGRKVKFLNPPLREAAWSEDGSRLAILTTSGILGSHDWRWRIEIYDTRGNETASTEWPDRFGWPSDLRWTPEQLVIKYFNSRGDSGLYVLNPLTGDLRRVDFRQQFLTWTVLGPTTKGDLYVARETTAPSEDPDAASDGDLLRPYVVHRIDTARAVIDPEPMLQDEGRASLAHVRLSPSGRYWMVDRNQKRGEERPLLDLQTGEEITIAGRVLGTWLVGDRVAWVEKAGTVRRLMMARPGAAPRTLREWSGAEVGRLASPDLARLFVTVYEPTGADLSSNQKNVAVSDQGFEVVDGENLESWVYDVREDRWIELPIWPRRVLRGRDYHRAWAGTATLARVGPGYLALERLDRPGEVQDLIGSY